MNSDGRSKQFAKLAKIAIKIEPNELKATLLSFLFVFSIMAAYFILRPVRDALSCFQQSMSDLQITKIHHSQKKILVR